MIALASDFLVFQMASGERVPLSPEMITLELLGETAKWFDEEMLRHAAKATFHYFRHDLKRDSVTVREFATALEKVLRGFRSDSVIINPLGTPLPEGVIETDLRRLAVESAEGCELFFFPRLREELRQHLRQNPRVLRFRGLRGCVKHLTRSRRWGLKCRRLAERILAFLEGCVGAEARPAEFSLVVDL
jgi:hypothetical protein